MYNMKKIISIAIAAIMMLSVLALTACGGGNSGSSEDLANSKYVGTWVTAGVALGDESGELDVESILTLNGDGTGTLTTEGEDPANFTWELTSDGFKTKGDMKLKFTDEGDGIKANIFGADLLFVRQ